MPSSLVDWFTSLAPVVVVAVSGVYAAGSALLGRVRRRQGRPCPGAYPGSREQAGDWCLAWWRSLSTAQQAAYDQAVLDAQDAAGLAAREAGERAVRSGSAL